MAKTQPQGQPCDAFSITFQVQVSLAPALLAGRFLNAPFVGASSVPQQAAAVICSRRDDARDR